MRWKNIYVNAHNLDANNLFKHSGSQS